MKNLIAIFGVLFVSSCFSGTTKPVTKKSQIPPSAKTELATFSGGCFWCMESPFEKLSGVSRVTSGYTGGEKKNPTYKQVSSGSTKHRESIEIEFDPEQISYEDLLEVFWRNVDPTDIGGQFVDRGYQYTTAIFYHSEAQKIAAEKSKAKMEKSNRFKKKIVTPIVKATAFYPAEDYHQDYYKKNPIRYHYYRSRSGRDDYIDSTWGEQKHYVPKTKASSAGTFQKPSEEELKKRLSKMQYHITQEEGTEPPFKNEYWNNKQDGIYVDIVSGEPLFSSTNKFKSGTGWPSFYKPLEPENIVEKEDRSLFSVRTEVRSKHGDSHLGHVFNDGPKPTGLRYCINSAALRFIPKEKLKDEGYEKYLALFAKK